MSHSARQLPRRRVPSASPRPARRPRTAWRGAGAALRRGALGCALAAVAASGVPGAARAAAGFPAQSAHGMVVSSEAHATRAGVAMLELGGNAVDAAVATAFAVGVTQPFSTGIGGGGFMLIRTADGEVFALDARETAPAAAHRDLYVEEGVPEDASLEGPLAVATPGLVAGLVLAQERWGSLPLERVVAPAIRLAREGFPIAPYHARMIGFMRPRLAGRFPGTAAIQFPPEDEAAEPGWRLVQEDLARTLERVAAKGAAGFYEGPVAEAIAGTLRERGGLVTEEDLAAYRPVVREPVTGRYRGYEVLSFPPPSSGGVALVEMLNVLEGFDLASRGPFSSDGVHVVAEAMKLAFADRAVHLGDPDFVDVPVERLTSRAYADELRRRIEPPWWRRAPWDWFGPPPAITVRRPGLSQEDAGTTHLSVTDAAGNAVAMTKTINTPYGSGITVPGTGIVLNNEMDDFSKAVGVPNVYGLVDETGANAIAPGKRPLSSMTPTILAKDGRVFMVTGSPGGPRIITTTLLTILNVVDHGMDVQEAVAAPRFHHQWLPDRLHLEPPFAADVVENLRRRGHEVERSSREWSAAEAVVVDAETGLHRGGSDPRRGGLALGPGTSEFDH